MAPAGRSRLIPTTRVLPHGTVVANACPMPPDAPEIHTRELVTGPNLLVRLRFGSPRCVAAARRELDISDVFRRWDVAGVEVTAARS
jgi:hypothetical protein